MKLFLPHTYHTSILFGWNIHKNVFLRKFSDNLTNTINKIAEMDDIKMKEIISKNYPEKNKNIFEIKNLSISYLFHKEQLNKFNKTKNEILKDMDNQLKQMVDKEEKDLWHNIEKDKKILSDRLFNISNETSQDYKDNVIIEILPGAGGEDAAMFADELLEMYKEYAIYSSWEMKMISHLKTDHGGVKEALYNIEGIGVLNNLSFERGVHRVQRIPFNSDRIHTSTASVVVTPKPDDVKINIDYRDLKVETMRCSGPGGQSVQKRNTAVRMTHVPTGVSVHVMDERSATGNKQIALEMIRNKIYLTEYGKKSKIEQEERRKQMGMRERHEKIRTYNFGAGRVTDHRIDYSLNINLSANKELIEPKLLQSIIDQLRWDASEQFLNQFIIKMDTKS